MPNVSKRHGDGEDASAIAILTGGSSAILHGLEGTIREPRIGCTTPGHDVEADLAKERVVPCAGHIVAREGGGSGILDGAVESPIAVEVEEQSELEVLNSAREDHPVPQELTRPVDPVDVRGNGNQGARCRNRSPTLGIIDLDRAGGSDFGHYPAGRARSAYRNDDDPPAFLEVAIRDAVRVRVVERQAVEHDVVDTKGVRARSSSEARGDQRTQLARIRTLDIRLANSVMAWMEE